MKAIVRLIGFCLVSFAAGTYLADVRTGGCAMLFVLGAGLILDAIKK